MFKNKVQKLFLIFFGMTLITGIILYISKTKYPETLFSILGSLLILFLAVALIFLAIYSFIDIKEKINNKDYIGIIIWIVFIIVIVLYKIFL
ncbi:MULTISPECIES: hypothetical protein [Helcococcus]|uniref:Uncharacterized protein n=1 Tax=Helcococcus bovis TaxID=3153252 RepID=A0ABW9F634_9FIRM